MAGWLTADLSEHDHLHEPTWLDSSKCSAVAVVAVSLSQAINDRARNMPERPAITAVDGTFTRLDVDERVDAAASRLIRLGVAPGETVAVSGTNNAQLLMSFFAIWRAGAVPLALHPRRSDNELAELLGRGAPRLAIGFRPSTATATPAVEHHDLGSLFAGPNRAPPPAPISPNIRIGTSGGSTGAPKLIAVDVPAIVNPDRPWHYGMRADGTHVVPLDIVDGTGFVATTTALALGCHVVLMDRFDPVSMLALVEQHRSDWLALTQPAMVATIKLAPDVRAAYDISSLRCVTHYSGGVADWVKRAWIDWLGADRIAESYGATDARGSAWIDGREWLAHPGSVGRAQPGAEFAIFDGGRRLPPFELGHVFINDLTGRRNFHYLANEPAEPDTGTPNIGWETVGDMGWMDPDGYLYLADRASDMIRTARGLVAPLPIEGALEFHPSVRSALVVGIPHGDSEQIHAIIDATEDVTDGELVTMLADRFPDVPVPVSWERRPGPLRDNAGKARRRLLRDQRIRLL